MTEECIKTVLRLQKSCEAFNDLTVEQLLYAAVISTDADEVKLIFESTPWHKWCPNVDHPVLRAVKDDASSKTCGRCEHWLPPVGLNGGTRERHGDPRSRWNHNGECHFEPETIPKVDTDYCAQFTTHSSLGYPMNS